MKTGLAKYASQVDAWAARRALSGKAVPSTEALRDIADEVSGGDLDTTQLDIFCDMIDARIARWFH